MNKEFDYVFKLIIVGAAGVGKSQLLQRYTSDRFIENSKTTIGVDFGHKTLFIQNKHVEAQLWDTAGQERYKSIMPKFYTGTHGALLCYSIIDRSSFEQVRDWLEELQQSGCKFIILVGNKCDMEHFREVSQEEGEEFAHEHELLFIETSARESTNVNRAFEILINDILSDAISTPIHSDVEIANTVSLKGVALHPPAETTDDIKKCAC